MIVTINMIDDKKEKLLAVCNITIDPGDICRKADFASIFGCIACLL